MKLNAGLFMFLGVFAIGNLLFFNADNITPDSARAKGLKEPTAAELKEIQKVKVKKVNANKLALDRVNNERAKNRLPPVPASPAPAKEIETELSGAAASETSSTISALVAPAQVDNSMLDAFPVVGNQGNQASCVAWAATYYMMSHEVCLATGCDNKHLASRVFSPRWTYNMINGGVDAGSSFGSAFSLQTNHGAPMLTELPYNQYDPRGWDTNSDHWKSAINSRVNQITSLGVNTDTGMANLKQILANGHVVVIGVYINSWQYSTVMSDPAAASSLFAGQKIVVSQNGTAGAHAMTVVGYDDSIWTDMNGNGSVDSGERGAFKIANSWGEGYGNAGFIWASYDTFRTSSTVGGFSPSGRIQLTQGGSGYFSTYTPYQPKLLAKVTASHAARNQIRLVFGSSTTATQTPQTYWYPSAVSSQGGAYAFDGSSTEIESTFYFDVSSLATTSLANQLFYLDASDSSVGSALTIRSFELVDPVVGNTLVSAANVPMVTDAKMGRLIAGSYDAPPPPPPPVADTTAPSAPATVTAKLVSKRQGKRTTTSVSVTWSAASDNVAVTEYHVYRNGMKISETISLSFTDTSTVAGTSYSYQVKAVDAAMNQSPLSNMAVVNR